LSITISCPSLTNVNTLPIGDSNGDGFCDGPIISAQITVDQPDTDSDGLADICDPDDDGDGIGDSVENCPLASNPDQTDTDDDGAGNACDPDDDDDGVPDTTDNCPVTPNPDQTDTDGDGTGDACRVPEGLTLGIDGDTSGNTAASLGSIEACASVPLGSSTDIDLFVTNVADLLGWNMNIGYDPGIISVSGINVRMFQSADGHSSIFNASEAVPDADGSFYASAVDLNAPPYDDTGSGVPEEQVSKIFEPFFTTKSKGLGLGLSFTKRIIEEHGGKISFERKDTKGSRMTITLPVEKEKR